MKKPFIFILCLIALLVAACGAQSQAAGTPFPTFTPIPTFEFIPPTEVPEVATAAFLIAANGQLLDPVAVERGQERYQTLECGTCHGAAGEGSDKGSSLVASTIGEEDFISYMRSGGTVGLDHQYSTNRLSDSGGKNLYQYLLLLRQVP